MYGCSEVCDDGVVELASACTSMTHLDMSHCKKVTDRSIKAIASSCPQLEHLDVEECAVGSGKESALWALASGETKSLVSLKWANGHSSTWEHWFGGGERVQVSGPSCYNDFNGWAQPLLPADKVKEYDQYLEQNPPPGWAENRAGPAGLQKFMKLNGRLGFDLYLGGRQEPRMRYEDDYVKQLSIAEQLTMIAFIGNSITFFDHTALKPGRTWTNTRGHFNLFEMLEIITNHEESSHALCALRHAAAHRLPLTTTSPGSRTNGERPRKLRI
jgi:hypothetical protein